MPRKREAKYPPRLYRVREDINCRPAVTHVVTMPHVLDPDGRRQLTSWNAWHDREIAQHSMHVTHVEIAQSRFWRKKGTQYFADPYARWLENQERLQDFCLEKGLDVAEMLDERKLPRVEHSDLWAFYVHIGWDYRKKRYADYEDPVVRLPPASEVPEAAAAPVV